MQSSFHNCTFKKSKTTLPDKTLSKYVESFLSTSLSKEYDAHESSLAIAGDEVYQNSIKRALTRFKGIQRVILVGIGGSSLGTEAVYHALARKENPQLMVLDTLNKDTMLQFSELIQSSDSPEHMAIVVVSKSGATTETMMNTLKVLEIGEKKFGDAFLKQAIFIGDEQSEFYKAGIEKKILCFSFPSIIGGRYSVFTAVGMVPLILLGIDTRKLRKGAIAILSKIELKKIELSARTLAEEAKRGVHTVNFFALSDKLELIGFWYRQLLAESIGKRVTKDGTPFENHVLPIVSTEADLHSMSELYLGGYKNLYTHFISYSEKAPFTVLGKHWLLHHVPFLKRKSSEQVNSAIAEGVIHAYQDQKLPYRVTTLEACTPYEIGFLLATCMAEVMCLGFIFNIDPFHQPSVELYKKHTRALLDS